MLRNVEQDAGDASYFVEDSPGIPEATPVLDAVRLGIGRMERFHARCLKGDCNRVRVGKNADAVFNWGHSHENETGHEVEFRRTNGPHEEPMVFDL